jgi:hypothetical protein
MKKKKKLKISLNGGLAANTPELTLKTVNPKRKELEKLYRKSWSQWQNMWSQNLHI